jgi:hypothetical protein
MTVPDTVQPHNEKPLLGRALSGLRASEPDLFSAYWTNFAPETSMI